MNRWLFPALAVALISACSSEEPGPQANDKYKTRGSFCEAWADAACNDDVVDACGSSRSLCLEHQSTYCLNLVPTGYTSVNAETCVKAVERAYRDAELDAEELKLVQRLAAECSQLVDGGRPEGDDCTLTTECDTVAGYICIVKLGNELGSCQVPNVVGAGFACDEANVLCEDGFYCNGENCIASKFEPGDEDVACSHDEECIPSGYCEIEPEETEGLCRTRLGSSNTSHCTRDDQCESDFCFLTAANPYCTSKVVLTGESSVCSSL
jgi:hypothetical protein